MEVPYISRDLSWLAFNHRVLQEAMDEGVPLYERIKFLAIYSSNLDEFYRVRVASLRSFKALKKKTRKELDIKPKRELKEIRRLVEQQQQTFGRVFRQEILPALQKKGIYLIADQAYDAAQQQFLKKYFFEKIYPLLQPTLLDDKVEPPFLENAGLYFVVHFSDNQSAAIVNIPSDKLPRFVELPSPDGSFHLTFLDDVLRFNLEDFFKQDIAGAFSIKLSRDAEMYIEDEYSGDLLEKIKQGLEERSIGLPTRFLFDNTMPSDLLQRLKEMFNLRKSDMIPGARYHNFNDFFNFPNLLKDSELYDLPMPPLPHADLEGASSIMAVILQKDIMLHFPYQKYDYVLRLLEEAVHAPSVKSIKITLYRVASQSAVVKKLLEARQADKEVTVFVEAKARFDEQANLQWGAQLEQAGAKVFYSYPDIKVHSKLLLISTQEDFEPRHYAYIATGNFNEKTARLYGDHALLTTDNRLTTEVAKVFNLLERKILVPNCKHLLVSPFSLRDRFEALIDQEIEHARAGKTAYMILKMNSLEDQQMIKKLYEASQAGVRIQLIIRGICCIAPGVDGLSEQIEAISIVDRFLEHARVYIFANNGDEQMYIASADWMLRNLSRRVEVAVPIYDPMIYRELRHIIDIQLRDNSKARCIDANFQNMRRQHLPIEASVRAQADIYRFLEQSLAEKNAAFAIS